MSAKHGRQNGQKKVTTGDTSKPRSRTPIEGSKAGSSAAIGSNLKSETEKFGSKKSTKKAPSVPFWKDWDNFWFGYGSPTTLGLFRIFAATINFLNLCLLLFDFGTWFTEQGFVPVAANNMMSGVLDPSFSIFGFQYHLPFIFPRISLLANCTNAWITLAFFLGTMIALLLTAFGLWTRAASIIAAIGIVSLNHRNMLILHGGDTVMRISILYVAIAPSGAACSLDRLIALWRGKTSGPPQQVSLWPQRLVQFNVALIYFTTWWLKMDGDKWRNGTAVYYTERLHEFYRFWVPAFIKSPTLSKPLTYATIVTELALGTIIFYKPARKWVLLAGVLMHAYIEYSMNIPFFAWAMVAMYICFYEGDEIEGWAKRVGHRLMRWKIQLYRPTSRVWATAPLSALQAADPFSLIDFEPESIVTAELQTQTEWISSSNGKRLSLANTSLREIGFWPWVIVPSIWRKILDRATEDRPLSRNRKSSESKNPSSQIQPEMG